MPVWKTFRHNGIAFPDAYSPKGLSVRIVGQQVRLSPLAEEMAYAFAKKKDTPYVQDAVFRANFMKYFVKQLPPPSGRHTKFEDVDLSEFYRLVDQEKKDKEAMTKEAKKSLAAARKEKREALRTKYGKALLDGKEIEIANWMAEPPGLFMGRGCIAGDTIVKTSSGVKYAQELEPGDKIATHHGSGHMFYRTVSSIAQQGVRTVFNLRTRTHSIRATDNHPFLALRVSRKRARSDAGTFTRERYPASLEWTNLSELTKGDYVVVAKRYQTPGTSKFSKSKKRTFRGMIMTPTFARILGYYLGDGFMAKRSDEGNSHIAFSEGHPKLVEKYSEMCRLALGISPTVLRHSGGNSVVLAVYSKEIADVIASTGITGEALTKRVPDWIFELADDLKFAFIRGYLDADGNFFVKTIQDVEYASFGFESPNKRLIEDLRELSISAGLQVSNITSRDGHGFTKGRSYRFFISEYQAVNRLLDSDQKLSGARTRFYSLDDRLNDFRKQWDWSRLHILDSKVFGLERVLEISPEGQEMTYDVSMNDPRYPNFVANGFVVHNSHPLRGSWKPRVSPQDVTLNLDKGSPVPEGGYKVTHDTESIWIARWIDKLTDKEKYVWPHESSHIQQSRNKDKYDKALKIGARLPKLQASIRTSLSDSDERVRKIATVSYLIDEVGMRVGDEKDEDEADTVGATTLRVEHVKMADSKSVEFDFLGKDSVRWVKKLEAPDPALIANLRKFTAGRKPVDLIFEGVSSSQVNAFLSDIIAGISAKVFRTYHATRTVEEFLKTEDVNQADDLEKLYFAKNANLAAAIYCNHKRTPPKTWEESLKKKEQKLAEYKAQGKEARIKKMEMDIEMTKKTKEYNLNTSLKNYIDPRIFKTWCDSVGLDWAKLYSKSLQRKFSWVAQSEHVTEEPMAAAPVPKEGPKPSR